MLATDYGATVPGFCGTLPTARPRCCRSCNRGWRSFCDTPPAARCNRLRAVAVRIVEINALGDAVKNRLAEFHIVLFELSINFLQLGECGDFEGDMLHADLLQVRHRRARFGFPERQHVMVVFHIGAEEDHAAVVFTDLGKAQDLGEKLRERSRSLTLRTRWPTRLILNDMLVLLAAKFQRRRWSLSARQSLDRGIADFSFARSWIPARASLRQLGRNDVRQAITLYIVNITLPK